MASVFLPLVVLVIICFAPIDAQTPCYANCGGCKTDGSEGSSYWTGCSASHNGDNVANRICTSAFLRRHKYFRCVLQNV